VEGEALKGTLIKIADPQNGVTRQEYETICKALGVTPKPRKNTTPGK
jgi:hypothetical protein